ncbi:S24 family peptidase [Rhodovulum sp. ES.010]|uniref:S24 family peptidase n=1 Tax=Rhodovulum sp. ES.010 TaxID=1882821 RepID=UPI000941710D|nr:S24 family peptidase [Rhodovulum sp. ES.010]
MQLGALAFERAFLRAQGANPENCSIIAASGDSMQPAIPDGALLVVDHGQTEIRNGHMMVINVGEDLLVKRIRRRLDGLLDLISDNPAYAPETVGRDMIDQLRIVGRVVYYCRAP